MRGLFDSNWTPGPPFLIVSFESAGLERGRKIHSAIPPATSRCVLLIERGPFIFKKPFDITLRCRRGRFGLGSAGHESQQPVIVREELLDL